MTRQRLTTAERVRVLTARATMAEAAQAIGVSVRTLRRWKNEGKEPGDADTRRKLVQASTRERAKILRAGRTGSDRYVVPPVPVAPPTHRVLWRDWNDPSGKRKIISDTIAHDIRNMTISDVQKLLRYYADRGAEIRFVYRVPIGGTSLGGKEYLKGGNASTMWKVLLPSMSEDRLLSFIYDLHPSGITSQGRRLLYMMVHSDGKGIITKERREEIVRKRDAEKRRAARKSDKAHSAKARKAGGTKARPKRRK